MWFPATIEKTNVISKRSAITLAFAVCAGLAIYLLVVKVSPGVMESKFRRLTEDMTKAEVEAILGETGASLEGGIFSTSDQFHYAWEGDDGLIVVSYVSHVNDEFAPFGPPGMRNQIKHKEFQPYPRSVLRIILP